MSKRRVKGVVIIDNLSKSVQDLMKPSVCKRHKIEYVGTCKKCSYENNKRRREERAADPFSIKKLFI